MNIRKNIDYSQMYAALDTVMADRMPQMEVYCAIGKAVCQRTEKGAAVAASEYLCKQYPDVHGLSPRSLRRMRDFYRTYENEPQLMAQAMEIGWIQNVVIMEADLTMELRKWYIQAVKQFGWSKAELTARIAENAHEFIVLAIAEEMCYSEEQEEAPLPATAATAVRASKIRHLSVRIRCRRRKQQGGWRRWPTTLWPMRRARVLRRPLRCSTARSWHSA